MPYVSLDIKILRGFKAKEDEHNCEITTNQSIELKSFSSNFKIANQVMVELWMVLR